MNRHRHPEDTAALLQLLRDRGWTLAVAESLTGGLLSSLVCDVPGASDVHLGGVVSYATRVKRQVLQVPPGPVISEGTARAMATGVARLLRADCAAATTGVAGPATQEGRPAGTVCVAAVTPQGVVSRTLQLRGGRPQVRHAAAVEALALLHARLLKVQDAR